jgi:acyl carrier protein
MRREPADRGGVMEPGARIAERIGALLRERVHVEPPGPDVDLFAVGVLDSLAFVDLLLHLEREFAIAITPEDVDVERFQSIAKIARFVAERR